VSNFFEQELRKLFRDGQIIKSPAFTGPKKMGIPVITDQKQLSKTPSRRSKKQEG